jgi:hypothetical protein
MRYSLVLLCSALFVFRALLCDGASAAESSGDDILKDARTAMGGAKLDGVRSLILSVFSSAPWVPT